MSLNIVGHVVEIKQTVQITESFKKRDFVIQHGTAEYPEFSIFELAQDKVHLIDNYPVGKLVEVHFNLKGRKWLDNQGETKYFNTMQAWNIVSKDVNSRGNPVPSGGMPF